MVVPSEKIHLFINHPLIGHPLIGHTNIHLFSDMSKDLDRFIALKTQ